MMIRKLILHKIKISNTIIIEPENALDLPMFRHCTGKDYVINKYFNRNYRTIFAMHEISIYIIDRTRNPNYTVK